MNGESLKYTGRGARVRCWADYCPVSSKQTASERPDRSRAVLLAAVLFADVKKRGKKHACSAGVAAKRSPANRIIQCKFNIECHHVDCQPMTNSTATEVVRFGAL